MSGMRSHFYSGVERRKFLALYRKSGLKRPDFCRRHKIAYTTFCGWERREGREGTRFRRVRVSPVGWLDSAVAEVVISNGVKVRVLRGCAEAELGWILEAARRCGA